LIIPATGVMIQDGNCIGQYAANKNKNPKRLQVIELDFAIVKVINIPLIRYSTGRKHGIDRILSSRVNKIVINGYNTKLMVQPLVRTSLVKTRNHARCCRRNLSCVKSLSKARCILIHNDKNNQTNRGIFKQSIRCYLEGMVIVAPYCWSINLNHHSIWCRCNKKRKTKHPFMSGKKDSTVPVDLNFVSISEQSSVFKSG
jgi:hypothetical protein